MRLLVITQKVDRNDPVLGFFHRWIIEFAKNAERIFVICLCEGEHNFPKNVKVFSLGKEKGTRRFNYVIRFYQLLWNLRGEYDGVFVHMNQIYVILGSIVWRVSRIPVALWYAHRAKTFSLWCAEKFAIVIFTNSRVSFTVPTSKAMYLGHGIDMELALPPSSITQLKDQYAILCVGRISPDKDQATIIRACGLLSRQGLPVICTFVGAAVTAGDDVYLKKLMALVREENLEGKVFFKGGLPQTEVAPFFWKSNIHINACEEGSLDKVVLEAAAGGAIPIVANEAFRDTLQEYADRLIFKRGNANSLAKHISDLLQSKDKETIRGAIAKRVRENFDITVLIKKIINWYETSR